MAEHIEETGKTVRTTLESLVINVTNDELKYRSKYLPDPRRLSDDKIVCTVCSVSLASRVRKGKDIFIHSILGVLVCKNCHNFYGDGIFSTDEDGEDKYCRWCGQGGTLYLCSKCNCGFCKKCMMKNMKNSALAAIETDDWKCLICIPRPIFGSRAVCWASRELNNSVRKNELLRMRLEEEKKRIEVEKNLSGIKSEEENPAVIKKKKRVHDTDDSDSSTIFIPTKKPKKDAKTDKSLNGSVKKHRRKDENSSPDSELSDDDHSSKWEKRKRKRQNKQQSLSSEESSATSNKPRKNKKIKKKSKKSSSESSDSEESVSKSKTKKKVKKSFKTKRKNKSSKRKNETTSDSSSTVTLEKPKKKKNRHSKIKSLSDTSSDEDRRKSDSKGKPDIENPNETVEESDFDGKLGANNKDNSCDEVKLTLTEQIKLKDSGKSAENEVLDEKETDSPGKPDIVNGSETLPSATPSTKTSVLVNELDTLQNVDQPGLGAELSSFHENDQVNDDEYTLSYHESSPSDKSLCLSQEDEIKVKVQLAVEWLDGVSSDIADLGNLIAERTNKFGEKKINEDKLCSYEDVLLTLGKLKQLLGGIHTNYKQIEDSLEDKLKSWKILAGLEKSDLEEQQYDVEEGGMEAESAPASEEIPTESGADTEIDVGESLNPEPNKSENELISESDSLGTFKEAEAPTTEPEIEPINECKENNIQNIVSEESACKQDPENLEKKNEPEQPGNECLENGETKTEEAVDINEATTLQELESEVIDQAIVKAELDFKSGSSNMVWSGLLSSDDDSDLNNELTTVKNSISDNEEFHAEDNQEPDVSQVTENNSEGLAESQVEKADDLDMRDKTPLEKEGEPTKKEDTDNFEALQELLYSSTEPEIGSSESDSEDSDDIQLDDSDLDEIFKPRKVIVKKSSKQKETKVKEETKENLHVKTDLEENKEDTEEKSPEKIEAEKEEEEPLDSEAEIDMLTDLTKLKKKTVLRRVEEEESSNESSSDSSQEEGSNEDLGEGKKRRKKYNTKIKKQREKERNELFGFLQGDSSAEDEADITKNDLDVMEDQYVSESSDSMSLEAFSRKMNEKWRELEKEQDQLNLEILLASESDQGSIGGNDILSDSDKDQKKKKEKKIKEEKVNDDEANVENEEEAEAEAEIKEEKAEAEAEIKEEKVSGEEPDQQYEEFLEGLTKTRTTFTGLGSSSEEDKDRDRDDIEIKEELLSDQDAKVKKEPKDSDEKSCTNSDSSSDLFLDLTKKKSEKKTIWRQHKLLKIKLSDTDTSDEERWWQRRLEREKKKKERGDDSPKKSQSLEKRKSENGSDKENKKNNKEKHKEEEEANSSSTLEMSSTDSSGSEVFKKKKKKKKDSTDSDIMIVSDTDKKKKKKKKRTNLSGDSSDESDGSDDDVIDITQKSSQGESPGKGGRKNIRKVKTKHELAAATKAAAKEEEERKKRIAARQKLFNEMFEIKEAEILEKLVLDFDPETKTELISVDKDLVTKMKPHQAKGVKFMWDSCFESLSQLKTKKGSGCILAHCMGLGKTFQVVSLVHTILTHKDTNVRTVLVVCPLSTVLNWFNEFDKWLEDVAGGRNIKIYHLTKFKKAHERSKQLSLWHRTGGVMIIGYEMFRILANPNSKKFRLMHTQVFQETLIDPGADLVVCDEGHMLKNESTLLSKAMSRIRTLRRIVLTGTPMQNNLKEYHCMVQFVKPNLLGTRKEFLNQFVNPITNGQFVDSTEADVKVMKRRAHVLHKMLEGLVQRFDYSVLTPFLPPKHEYVISLRLSDVQVKLYQFYLDYFCRQKSDDKRTSSQLFQDWQVLGRVWTHPRVLKMSFDKAEKERQKQESEDEGSIKDFINDKSSSSSLSLSSSSDGDENGEKKEKSKKKKDKKEKDLNKIDNELEKKEAAVPKGSTTEPVDEINLISSEEEDVDKQEVEIIEKQNTETQENENKGNDSGIEDQEGKTGDEPVEEETSKTEEETIETEETTSKTDTDEKGEKESIEDEKPENNEEKNEKDKKTEAEQLPQLERRGAWWKDIVEPEHFEDINQSAKLIVLFAILRECEMIEDKVLVFSQSLFSLDLIEYFLQKVDRATEENRLDESLGNHAGCWQKGLDYFRLDGSSSSENRSIWCKSFNREDNPRARLFLISTRAGGLGINLTGANRVVIFDASWNPSHDIQSIFRIYRFGQKKPCYVYRFVAHGTMEEKVYERQVAKQLLSSRVVDEQQVQRHFSMSDLNELYTFTPPQERTEKPTPVLPKDMLMAELLTQYNDWIEKYHEHDSLLENIAEEELNEEERKLAWEDYENEKKRGFPPPTVGGVPNFPAVTNQLELFRKSLKLKFPNATDSEMNAMLHTLMFQVNRNNMSMMSQQAGAQQQLNQQNQASSSQQQQNFRPMNTNNKGPSQPFNSMTQVYQKPFGAQQMQQQRVSVNQMNQQRMGSGLRNQPMIGNGQIRKTNRSSQEVYMEEMRKQQAANLARIQNQKKFQQQFQQNNPGQQQTQRPRITRVDKGVARGPRLAPQTVQSNTRMWGPQATQSSQQTRIIPNKLQQMQRKQNNALNILNARQQMQVSSVRSDTKPVGNSLQQRQWKTPSQIKQEEMRQRIKELQRQKNRQALQQRTQPASQKGSSIDPVSRQLEEMKKRYNASRKSSAGSSTPISIVELDDDPIL